MLLAASTTWAHTAFLGRGTGEVVSHEGLTASTRNSEANTAKDKAKQRLQEISSVNKGALPSIRI